MCRGPAWPEPTAAQAPGDRSRGRAARSIYVGGDFVDAAAGKAAKPLQVIHVEQGLDRQLKSGTTGASLPISGEAVPPPPVPVPPVETPFPPPPSPPAPVPPLEPWW